jgi:hypothetical protein
MVNASPPILLVRQKSNQEIRARSVDDRHVISELEIYPVVVEEVSHRAERRQCSDSQPRNSDVGHFFGHPHSDEMRFTERYRRADHDTMQFPMTIDDPKAYTRPWVSETKILELDPKAELQESLCIASEEESFAERIRNPADGKNGR